MSARSGPENNHSARAWITPAAAVVVIGAMAWLTRRYFMDDAFIGFRYLNNLLSGRGLVFNPGERVEGITNLGWVLALAPLASIPTIPAAVAGLSPGGLARDRGGAP